jgi:hypothetical protein
MRSSMRSMTWRALCIGPYTADCNLTGSTHCCAESPFELRLSPPPLELFAASPQIWVRAYFTLEPG